MYDFIYSSRTKELKAGSLRSDCYTTNKSGLLDFNAYRHEEKEGKYLDATHLR